MKTDLPIKTVLTATVALNVAALAATAGLAQKAPAQKAATPKTEAVYWMSAETVSGMATGQPTGVQKNLMLQLGSARRNPAPTAEHLPPEALRAGASLPLVTPAGETVRSQPGFAGRPDITPPKGRIELYWGCGSMVTGQPVVIDLAAMKPGAGSAMGAALNIQAMTPPAPGRNATYGEWPNAKTGKRVPRAASLAGDHMVKGNYSPDMAFSVAPANDFLAPLRPVNEPLGSGAVKVSWPALANARGYILSVTGAKPDGSIVMWTSSAQRMGGMALPDYLEQGDIARLVQQRILLAPETTECTVPAAVVKASPAGMLMMTAYGPEGNYGSPRTAPVGWAVKLRTKSTHMSMLGVDLAAMMAGRNR